MSGVQKATFPQKLAFLFQPHRYKVLYGGRGGAKSWGIARALLILGAKKPLRILCAREFQDSIADSVHELLKSQIVALGLQAFYEVQKTKITGTNGTEFVFDGLRHNINSLKSFEGADIVWVEEANNVSKRSWDVLIPTIRKEGSEIWISFNPEMAEDETYKRFVMNPPANAKVVKIGWRDNPWFPKVLMDELLDLKARDHNAYLNVWEGETVQVIDGAIYAKEIKAVLAEGRRTKVRYDPSRPVHTFWDLGRSDRTSIWFVQLAAF
ncbi:MAG: PBSX family phage terminase large subunit, partial [Phycisphaerales bacterium]|nr:PBSX family phage terminase large subunit [Phycisphaerales bacterium]